MKSAAFVLAPVTVPQSLGSRSPGPQSPGLQSSQSRPRPPGQLAADQPPESLRDRKKRLTRAAIFDAAQRLFAERGFDDVTVAEIADAANISVKTLFTYVRSKEELVFGNGPTVLDAVVAAVRDRRIGETPLVAATKALLAAAGDAPAAQSRQLTTDNSIRSFGYSASGTGAAGHPADPARKGPGPAGMAQLATFCRMAHATPEAASRLRAMWAETEDALAAALAKPKDGPPERAARRLEAAQIMVLVRTVTSEEVTDLITEAGGGTPGSRAAQEALREWIRDAAGSLARGLQATRR